jgi:hypothetical protein
VAARAPRLQPPGDRPSEEGALVLLRVSAAHGWARPVARRAAALAIGALLPALAPAQVGAQSSAPPSPDPVAASQGRVDEARHAADAMAGRYFAQLDRYEALGSEIAGIEARVGVLEQQVRTVRAAVRRRAVAAYKTGSSGPELAFETGDMADVSRAAKLLGAASARDGAMLSSLHSTTDDLKARRDELAASRHEQGQTLRRLRAAQRDLDRNVRAAVSDRQEIVARLATQSDRIAAAAPARAPPPSPVSAPPPPVDPPPPPVGYVPHAGVHPRHDEAFLACTRSRETGGRYSAVNPSGPFYGAYQFLQTTWNITANHAGRLELVGVRPSVASEYDQDDMAWTLYTWQGNGPWGGLC